MKSGRETSTRVRHGRAPSFFDIVDTFKTAWRFTKLSDSRWVTLGPASQALVVAALCGLENLVSFIRSKVEACSHSSWAVLQHSWERQGSSWCRASDSVLQLLLKDPRVCLQHDEIWKVASEELLWVASLEDSVMRRGRGRSR